MVWLLRQMILQVRRAQLFSSRFQVRPLLDQAANRRDASASAYENNWRFWVKRVMERWGRLNGKKNIIARLDSSQKAGANTSFYFRTSSWIQISTQVGEHVSVSWYYLILTRFVNSPSDNHMQLWAYHILNFISIRCMFLDLKWHSACQFTNTNAVWFLPYSLILNKS